MELKESVARQKQALLKTLSEAIKKEAGDVLWQLSQCLREYGMSMQEVAEMNLKKLEDRQQRGVLRGFGDNR